MKYRLIRTLLACVAAAASAGAHADKVDDYLRAQMALNHVPGAAVAIVRDGKVVKLQTYGLANLEWQQKVTPDTRFQLASSTKPFTGMLLARLAEAGKLKLDDSIALYIKDAPEAWKAVTVRELANHSSGIPDQVKTKDGATLDDYVAAAAALPLAHAPGESSEYGIGGYNVLSKVIEVAAGMPYTEALVKYVVGPLGLRDTAFENATGEPNMRSVEVLPRRAGVYDWRDGRYVNFSFFFGPMSYDAGGLLTSAADLAKVAVALDGTRFLRQESKDAMWWQQPLGKGGVNNFGAGWAVREINGHHTVGHSGGPALSDILHFPKERATFIVLTNGQSLYPYLAQGLSELYFPPPPVVMPKGIEDTRPAVTAELRAMITDALAGKVDESHFSPGGRKDFVGPMKTFLLPFFRSLKGFDEFVLVIDEPKDGGIHRQYRARHGSKAVTWDFGLDAEGKINGFGPK